MKQNYLIPASIVIAGLLIAVSVYSRNSSLEGTVNTATGAVAYAAERPEGEGHVRGNIDAPIKIVEFSDYECPFCSRLHPTLERIVAESDGRIAWEYRHLPLPSHRNAEEAAYSGECIARLGGNKAFWSYTDEVFKNQGVLGTSFFESEAARLGIDLESFRTCIQGDEVKNIVENDLRTATSLGGRGTPFSVIIFEDGSTRPISGALPYEQWIALLAN